MLGILMAVRPIVLAWILMAVAPLGSLGTTPDGFMGDPGAWTREGMVLDIGPPGSYDGVLARDPVILRDAGMYWMWYTGFDGSHNRILYATSSDRLTWSKQGLAISVLQPPFNFDSVVGRTVMKIGSTYRMWFAGGYWSGGPSGIRAEVYYAESSDARTWTIEGLSLGMGPSGTWDGTMVHTPTVLRDSSGTYRMYYQGWDGSQLRIGLATSTDGRTFTRVGAGPVLDLGPLGSWDADQVWSPSVLEGSPWQMWYTGSSGTMTRIGLATSPDGIAWAKSPGNPVFTEGPLGSWDEAGVQRQTVLWDPTAPPGGPVLLMYYTGVDGTNARIGLARQAVPTSDEMGVDCNPDTINLRSSGRWIVCYLEPPVGRAPSEIVAVEVRLDSWLAPVLDDTHGFAWDPGGYLVDHDHDGVLERLLKFDRQMLSDELTPGEHTFRIDGEYTDGTGFTAQSDVVRVIP